MLHKLTDKLQDRRNRSRGRDKDGVVGVSLPRTKDSKGQGLTVCCFLSIQQQRAIMEMSQVMHMKSILYHRESHALTFLSIFVDT